MAIKVKLQDMGVKVEHTHYPETPAKGKTHKVIEYPEVRLNSKNVPGLEKLTLDSKCHLMFEAEVKSLSEPDQWDKERMGLKEGDVLASFKLVKGEIMPAGGDSKTYGEASIKAGK